MSPTDRPKRRLSSAARFWVLLGACMALGGGLAAAQALMFGEGAAPPPALTGAMLLVVFAGVLLGSWWWWVRADEAAREAHKWSWYWGGSVGMTLGLFGLLILNLHEPDAPPPPGVSYSDALLTGAVAILFLMVLGYGVAWAAWWITKRR